MISLKKRNQGFTIVELLIVIVVIGILALLIITTYSGIQAKARNSKRASDVAAVQTQLEAFFQNSGYYPSLGDMNDATWLKTNLPSLDTNALIDPSNASHSATLADSTTPSKQYGYKVTASDGSSCEGSGQDVNCAKYTLTATYEGTFNGQTSVSKNNLD